MNNRMSIGLAVGAGYLLGRTKKAKLAFTVGTLVMGKKLKPDAEALASFVGSRLKDHPQFKEIREQLSEDLRGVGSAAVGALVDRRLEAVADRLHTRTRDVQDRLDGLLPSGGSGDGPDGAEEEAGARPAKGRAPRRRARVDDASDAADDAGPADEDAEGGSRPARRAPAKKAASRSASSARRTGGKASSSGTSGDASGGSGTGRRRPAKRTASRGEGSDDG